MAKKLADLWGEADKLNSEGKKVAEAKATAAKLPFTLKDEFRKAQDPALDVAINKAESDTFGAAIKGLNMYQDISNPFARRDLAEEYQGGVSMGYKNLTDERTRRQGVYTDYISKWTGLFGAEAAKQSDLFQNKLATFDRESNLAATEESNRRWEIENKRAEESHRKSMASGNRDKTTVTGKINELHAAGASWEEISSYLASPEGGGIDVNHGSDADIELNRVFVPGFTGYAKEPSPETELQKEQLRKTKMENDMVEEERRRIEEEKKGSFWSRW